MTNKTRSTRSDKKFNSNAERQKAYRDRKAATDRVANPPPVPPRRGRRTEANAIIDYAGQLTCPYPPLAGQPFRLGGWQRTFLRKALARKVFVAGLSCARKNGKSGLIALVLAAYLVGPLNRPLWRALVVSLTGRLAGELRDQVAEILIASDLGEQVKVVRSPAPGRIEGLNGARVDFLASDRSSGHASSADLAIIDEAGLLPDTAQPLWAAVEHSLGARGGRLICISVRGTNEAFGRLADRAKTNDAVYWQEHAAAEGCAIDDRAAWRAANPGLRGKIKSIEWLNQQAQAALLSPSDEAQFRAMQLNLPGEPLRDVIVSLADWRCCETGDPEPRRGGVVLGVDLGGSSSMCAAAAIWPATGRLELWCAFGDDPPLAARGASDGVGSRYVDMEAEGELHVLPGRITPIGAFLGRVAGDLKGETIIACGADRFRKAEMIQHMKDAGLHWPLVLRATGGTSKSDAANDVRAFQRQVRSGDLSSVEHMGMTYAILESEIRTDPAGNPSLFKQRQRSRIDVLQAAVIATGLREQFGDQESQDWVCL